MLEALNMGPIACGVLIEWTCGTYNETTLFMVFGVSYYLELRNAKNSLSWLQYLLAEVVWKIVSNTKEHNGCTPF